MKHHKESICHTKFGNDEVAIVESDTKQPGERHDTYITIAWRWRGIRPLAKSMFMFVPSLTSYNILHIYTQHPTPQSMMTVISTVISTKQDQNLFEIIITRSGLPSRMKSINRRRANTTATWRALTISSLSMTSSSRPSIRAAQGSPVLQPRCQ